MEKKIAAAVKKLRKGGVILAPTDTVWGLMCDFENLQAVQKMLILKRADFRPIALLCSDWLKLESLNLKMSDYAKKLADNIWPGAMTLILKSSSPRIGYVAGEGNTIGIRVPDSFELYDLIEEFGKPLAATSANLTGQPDAVDFNDIPEEIKAGVDYIFRAKIVPSGMASTVVDCTGPNFKIVRQGEISLREIEQALTL
jgi:tRNA threonylcarbamoyl adenosine modification protein (Sua5/YciO/YrdC/YwlC family)